MRRTRMTISELAVNSSLIAAGICRAVSRPLRFGASLCMVAMLAGQISVVPATFAQSIVANVDEVRIVANSRSGKDWPDTNFDYAGTRFSPLRQIDKSNVKTLGLAWVADLDSIRGVEAPPVVVDGVMYETAPWSIVHAIDASTGKKLWVYDPLVPHKEAYKACCDVVNRGVAVHKGKVYVGSLDGRLIAVDA